jgi:hypothetical protein
MVQGETVYITPSWVNATTQFDIAWDTSTLGLTPKGDWWGDLALLGRTGSNQGEWEWDQANHVLDLWVPVPNSVAGHRRLVATLYSADLPLKKGAKGNGVVAISLPVVQSPPFSWEVKN